MILAISTLSFAAAGYSTVVLLRIGANRIIRAVLFAQMAGHFFYIAKHFLVE